MMLRSRTTPRLTPGSRVTSRVTATAVCYVSENVFCTAVRVVLVCYQRPTVRHYYTSLSFV